MKQRKGNLLIPALSVIILDQITKALILSAFPLHEHAPVISGFFNLVHVRNRGMAFGLMNRANSVFVFYALTAATIIAVALLLFWFSKLQESDNRIIIGFSLIIGGALGNLIDRVRLGEVVDFLDFYIGGYHWPAFNVADASITVGTFWVALNLFFQNRPPLNSGDKKSR
ncbi:MAG: signal peptidase II [Pseudomonadota bacterium]